MAKPASIATKETMAAMIARMVAIPKKANVIRGVSGGNGRPSAVATPFTKPPLNWSTPPAANLQVLPADEAVFIVSNDPLCAMIFTDKNDSAATLQQLWLVGGTPDNAVFNVSPGQMVPLAQDLYCSIPQAGARQFHSPRLAARKFKGKYWMWCDAPSGGTVAGNNITIQTGTIPMAAGDAVNISIYRLNEGDEVQVNSVRVPGPIAALSNVLVQLISPADYYRVEVTGDDENVTNPLNLTIQNNALCEILCHRALPDLYEREMSIVQAVRVLGAASHGMNLVSDQNATGSWVGDQPDGGGIWTQYIRGAAGANGFQKLTTQQGNEMMELKKYNPYTFVCPEDMDDMKYRHPFTFSASGGVTNVLNDNMDEFHYTIVYLKAGGTTVAVADAARNVQLEFFFAVEYTSDGLWPMPGVSPASQDDWEAAVKVLASMENITHNPAFEEIMKTIGKYVRLSPPILAMLGPYGKAASLVATGVGQALSYAGYRTKKTARPPPDEAGNPGGAQGPPKAARLAPMDARAEEAMGT